LAETYFRVPYGDDELAFTLPAGMGGLVIQPRPVEPVADAEAAVAAALAEPVGLAPLWAGGGK